MPRWPLLVSLLAACQAPPGPLKPGDAVPSAAASPSVSLATSAPAPSVEPSGSVAPASRAAPSGSARARAPAATGDAWIAAAGLSVTRLHPEEHHTWRQIEQLHWQAVADGPALDPAGPADAVDSPGCPSGMKLVAGGFLLDRSKRDDTDEVLRLQNETCTHWLTEDHELNGLCTRFDADRWHTLTASLPRRPVRVCMDDHEYPNVRGEYPLVVVTFAEAQKHCAQAGKRVCTESEWTLACEGEEGRPYPYGYERDEQACTIGILGPGPEKDMFSPRTTARTAHGADHSWRGTRSGEAARCVSPYGIHDLTGNVDEWTQSVRRGGYPMILKGGHWGPARQRCRPQTRGHGPHYVRYDQGFRCCADPSP